MTIIAETKAKYNKSSRVWELWDDATPYHIAVVVGGVTALPAAIEARRAVRLAGLHNDDPLVYRFVWQAIEAHPKDGPYIDRVLDAGRLVQTEGVRVVLNRRGHNQFVCAYVDDVGREDVEHTVRRGADFICTCADFKRERQRCAHILAVLIQAKVDQHYFQQAVEAAIERDLEKGDHLK